MVLVQQIRGSEEWISNYPKPIREPSPNSTCTWWQKLRSVLQWAPEWCSTREKRQNETKHQTGVVFKVEKLRKMGVDVMGVRFFSPDEWEAKSKRKKIFDDENKKNYGWDERVPFVPLNSESKFNLKKRGNKDEIVPMIEYVLGRIRREILPYVEVCQDLQENLQHVLDDEKLGCVQEVLEVPMISSTHTPQIPLNQEMEMTEPCKSPEGSKTQFLPDRANLESPHLYIGDFLDDPMISSTHTPQIPLNQEMEITEPCKSPEELKTQFLPDRANLESPHLHIGDYTKNPLVEDSDLFLGVEGFETSEMEITESCTYQEEAKPEYLLPDLETLYNLFPCLEMLESPHLQEVEVPAFQGEEECGDFTKSPLGVEDSDSGLETSDLLEGFVEWVSMPYLPDVVDRTKTNTEAFLPVL